MTKIHWNNSWKRELLDGADETWDDTKLDAIAKGVQKESKTDPTIVDIKSLLMKFSNELSDGALTSALTSRDIKMKEMATYLGLGFSVSITLVAWAAVWKTIVAADSTKNPLAELRKLFALQPDSSNPKNVVCCSFLRSAITPWQRDQIWRHHAGTLIDTDCFICERAIAYFEAVVAHVIAMAESPTDCPFAKGVEFDPDRDMPKLRLTCGQCNAHTAKRNLMDVKDAASTLNFSQQIASLQEKVQQIHVTVPSVLSREAKAKLSTVEILWCPEEWSLPADLAFEQALRGAISRFILPKIKGENSVAELVFVEDLLALLVSASPPDMLAIKHCVVRIWFFYLCAHWGRPTAEKAEANRLQTKVDKHGKEFNFAHRLQQAFLWATNKEGKL